MAQDRRIDLAVLQRLLDKAVSDAARWPEVCDGLAAIFGGIGTILIPIDPDRRGPWLVHSSSLARPFADYLSGGWHKHDYRQLGVPILRERGFVTDADFAEARAMELHPYYKFLRSHDLGGFIGLYFAVNGAEWCASIQRPVDAVAPTPDEVSRIRQIQPMLQAAAERASAAASAHTRQWHLLLSAQERGIAFVDRGASVHLAGDATRRMVDRFGLMQDERIVLPGDRADAQFRMMLARAADPHDTAPLPPPILLPARGSISLVVDVARLPAALRHFMLDVVAIVILREAHVADASPEEWLSRAYGLVPSEIRVAMGIGQGRSPRQIAHGFGLAEGTVRQQLKAVYRKVGVNSQVQLAAFLNASGGAGEQGGR